MPYPRRSYGRKQMRRRPGASKKPWYQKSYSALSLAKQALAGLWKLKGLVNSELYKLDNQDTGTIITDAGTYSVHLTNIAIGDGDSDRTGNSVYVRSLDLRGQFIYNTTGTDPQFVRLALVLDTQQIADTPPTYTQIYNGADYNAHLNPDTVGRFKILYSKVFALDNVNSLERMINIRKIMRHHVRYNGSTINDIQKGGLFLVACSSEPTNGPKIIWNCRTSYHDN